MEKTIRAYGTWSSPVTPESMAGDVRLKDVQWDDLTGALVWLEGHGGESRLLAQSGIDAPLALGGGLAIRGGVGYGGGDFSVRAGVVYFAGPGGRLYRQPISGGRVQAITPGFGRVASPVASADGRWVAYTHSDAGIDGLALVDAAGEHWPRKLLFDSDFVMQPAWYPDGKYIACVTWNHPRMPWDGSHLRVLALAEEGSGLPYMESVTTVAGGDEVAVFQPEFSPDGRYLAYVSDASGYGQIYLHDLKNGGHRQLTQVRAEHGTPAWIQGMRVFGWEPDSHGLVFLRSREGFVTVHRIDLDGKEVAFPELEEYTAMEQLAVSPRDASVAVIGSASQVPPRVLSYTTPPVDLPMQVWPDAQGMQVIVEEDAPSLPGLWIRVRATDEDIAPEALAAAESIHWTGHDGEKVHGLYYPPVSMTHVGVGAPPLIVSIHSGPTSQAVAGYDNGVQFFATRGFAVLRVNYRGSTGYGRDYMAKLRGNWGVYDVQDAASGAAHLVERGMADSDRLVIMGSSAGGFTVLQSLVDKPGFYRAGVCRYPVSNQFALAHETHKFEAYYNDTLLGALPDAADLWRARSPYFRADKIKDPVLVFQGADDPVVARSQTDALVESLRRQGVPHEYQVYAGEGHGFRQPETIADYHRRILHFLREYVIYG